MLTRSIAVPAFMRVTVLLAAVLVLPARTSAAVAPLVFLDESERPIFTQPSPVGDLVYTPGRGLRFGHRGLTLGGYTNLILTRDEGGPARVTLEDLSLFAFADLTPHLHFFTEVEYAGVGTIDDHGRVTSKDDLFTAERLYTDLTVSDAVNLRTGIFLTPVGRWNQIHAAPLVWTTSRPLTTEEPFDPNVTGVMFHGTVFPAVGAVEYFLFDQFAPPIEGNPDFDPADHSAGGRLELTALDGWSVGASYLCARRGGMWRHLGATDLVWKNRLIELMGELIVEDGPNGGAQWGAYLQGVLTLTSRLAMVNRYEHFAAPRPAPSVNLVTLGLAYRPHPAVTLKAEYLLADRHGSPAYPGIKASVATLF